jgi:hypothetical protein
MELSEALSANPGYRVYIMKATLADGDPILFNGDITLIR